MSGSRWKFMRKFEIPDATDPSQVYLRRWNVLATPWFSIKIHNILLPDADRALHDHPWPFGTFILKGSYLEELPIDQAQTVDWSNGNQWETHFVARNRFSFHRLMDDGLHRIHAVAPNTWTLVISGTSDRIWGFSPMPGTWYRAEDYFELRGLAQSTCS